MLVIESGQYMARACAVPTCAISVIIGSGGFGEFGEPFASSLSKSFKFVGTGTV